MATYIPNAELATEPVESRTVESAAWEFRTLKSSVTARIADLQAALEAEEAERIAADTNLQSNIGAEETERIAGDALIVDMVSPYITQIANLGFAGNMDLGLVSDPVIVANFDLGSL